MLVSSTAVKTSLYQAHGLVHIYQLVKREFQGRQKKKKIFPNIGPISNIQSEPDWFPFEKRH